MRVVDVGELGFDRGAQVIVAAALAAGPVRVSGRHPALVPQLRAWARGRGLQVDGDVVAGDARVPGEDAGDARGPGDVASARWGAAARGARVEAGAPAWDFAITDKDTIWSDDAARIYAAAAAAQWDPATIPWGDAEILPDAVEDAVVQVMTYLIENENTALVVPARFLGRIHPHFREVVQVLAVQVADEARHIEVFTRRALLRRPRPGTSSIGGQASLKTLLDEPDFALASFLLSVLGEGSFLELLRFLAQRGPDVVTRTICRLAAQDEARHVAFGLSHLERHVRLDPSLRGRLAASLERRHDALSRTSGLNEDVHDALVLLAAGSLDPVDVAGGWDAVVALAGAMQHARVVRLSRLGFGDADAERLSALHTRNFM